MSQILLLDYSTGRTHDRADEYWRKYRIRHDPPGMWTGFNLARIVERHAIDTRQMDQEQELAYTRFGIKHESIGYYELSSYSKVRYDKWLLAARREAWSWYARRAALVGTLKQKGIARLRLWPSILVFGDAACEACEAWEGQDAPAEEFPDILHRLGEDQGVFEPQTDIVFPIASDDLRSFWAGRSSCKVQGNGDRIFGIDDVVRSERSVLLYADGSGPQLLFAPYNMLIPFLEDAQ